MRELASLLCLLALAAPFGDAGAPSLGDLDRCVRVEALAEPDASPLEGPLAHGFFVPATVPALAAGEPPTSGGAGRGGPPGRRAAPGWSRPTPRPGGQGVHDPHDPARRLLLLGFIAHPSTAPPAHA